MQYPVLNSDSKAINLASKDSYSCLYDLVWSFDYAISGNPSTEAGFTVFLTTSSSKLSGGSAGIDLGYSGVQSFGLPYSVKPGVSGAAIGIGFDTTGLFAASATSGAFVRDGIDYRKVKKNSISIRGKAPDFSYNNYSYNVAISSLNSTFSIVESAVNFKTVRVRLGNVGRTIYIDYRNNPKEQFQRILEKDVSLGLPITAFLHAGVSFVTPISSSQSKAIGNIFIRNFHVEGSTKPNLNKSVISDPTTIPSYTGTMEYAKGIVTLVNYDQIRTMNGSDMFPF
jgi:hypothetical protein